MTTRSCTRKHDLVYVHSLGIVICRGYHLGQLVSIVSEDSRCQHLGQCQLTIYKWSLDKGVCRHLVEYLNSIINTLEMCDYNCHANLFIGGSLTEQWLLHVHILNRLDI